MAKEAIKEGNKILKREILTDIQKIKNNINEEVNTYTCNIKNNLRGKLDLKFNLLMDAIIDTHDLLQLKQLPKKNLSN